MYRAERSGVLSGLSRVRSISLNDAHMFCAVEQVGDEVADMLDLMGRAHAALGFAPHSFRLSLRGPDGRYLGEPQDWALAEDLLRKALDGAGVAYVEVPGEAAFYGPKIDVQIVDSGGRELSLATVQVDFVQPARLGLSYVDSGGAQRPPVMVHRSIIGSLERLFAHLIEVHDGAFPAWYAPVQLVVAPVGPGQDDAARSLAAAALAERPAGRGGGRRFARRPDPRRRSRPRAVRSGHRCPRGGRRPGVAAAARRSGAAGPAGRRRARPDPGGGGGALARPGPVRIPVIMM